MSPSTPHLSTCQSVVSLKLDHKIYQSNNMSTLRIKKRRSGSQLSMEKEISSRFREGCDLCEVTHMCSGVPALTNDPIKKLKIGIADNTYICHCKVCKQKYPHETIPVPGHEDLELPGFSCLSSLVFYAFICIHPDCASKVKYVGSTTQQLSARMSTQMSAGNNLLCAHDILHKGKTKIVILEAYTNGKHIKQLLEKREFHWTNMFQCLESHQQGGLQKYKPHGSRCTTC